MFVQGVMSITEEMSILLVTMVVAMEILLKALMRDWLVMNVPI